MKLRRQISAASCLLAAAVAAELAAAQGQPSSDATPLALETVTVTAQRREEALLDAPVTVTAIGSQLLEQQNVQDLTDLVALTPGLEIEPDGGRTSIRLRGISTADGAPAAENVAALHVDNIYMSHRTSLAGYFYDVDRVEVLQGPQGTLYGRNSAAGSINIISRRPVQRLEGSVDLEFGNYDHRRVQGMLNVPVTDTFALRGAFYSETKEGYFTSHVDERRGTYGRLAAQWNPSDRFSLYVKADFGDAWRRGNGVALIGTVDKTDPDNWAFTAFDEDDWFDDSRGHPGDLPTAEDGIDQSFVKNEHWGISTELTFNFNDNHAFILDAARIEEEFSSRAVEPDGRIADGGVGVGFCGGAPEDRDCGRPWLERVADARFQGTIAGQLDYTVGYFHWEDDTNEVSGNRGDIAFHGPTSEAESDAVYGQFTWTPPALQRLHITAGARKTEDWKKWDFQVVLFDSFVVGGSDGILEKEWDSTDWKVGLGWDLGENSLLYANVSTGYRSGSWFPGPIPQYDPEYVDAWELGWKGRLADNRLELSTNVYHYDYTDMAVQFDALNLISGRSEIGMFNLGASEIMGANISGTWLVSDNDLINFNIDYTDGEFTEFDFGSAASQYGPNYSFDTVFDWTGLALPNTTKWRASAGWNHTFNFSNGSTFDTRLQGLWNDDRYSNYRETTLVQYEMPGYLIDSYVTLDLNVRYRPQEGNWYLGAYVTNITDERILNDATGGNNAPEGTLAVNPVPNGGDAYITGQLRPPREYGMRFGYTFR
jgi:iron complex outermembrane recepter protein